VIELNSLEREVMKMLLAGDNPPIRILASQFDIARATSRQLTGAGFYTYFEVPSNVQRLDASNSFHFGDVIAEIEGLQHGAGFILHVQDGLIHYLEGYSYDEPWPINIEQFKLSYSKGVRDFSRLPK
jgi:hypothetical protein